MKIIRNNIIPFAGYKAMNLFGVLFVRGNAIINERTIRHETIHTEQWKELLWIGFLLWYVGEWIIRLFAFKGAKQAYRDISFEREAYQHDTDMDYIKNRKRFAFTRYIREKKA